VSSTEPISTRGRNLGLYACLNSTSKCNNGWSPIIKIVGQAVALEAMEGIRDNGVSLQNLWDKIG
jgi:hypothetical protein